MAVQEMFYGASPEVFEFAKALHNNMTEAEKKLWLQLRNKQLGYRFKPQHPVAGFVADFYCHQKKLAVEVDGLIHSGRKEKEYDKNRDAVFRKFGITIIRFTNDEVLSSIEEVVEEIKTHLNP